MRKFKNNMVERVNSIIRSIFDDEYVVNDEWNLRTNETEGTYMNATNGHSITMTVDSLGSLVVTISRGHDIWGHPVSYNPYSPNLKEQILSHCRSAKIRPLTKEEERVREEKYSWFNI